MDINDLYTVEACTESAEVQITNPITGEKTDCYIAVLGVDSKAFRESERAGKRKILKAANDKSAVIDVDDITADTLANITTGWRGFTSNGEQLKFSKEAAKELYSNSPHIANQVDVFMSTRANFIKG